MTDKNARIEFRLNSETKEELKTLANSVDLNLSDYLRNKVEGLVNRSDILMSIAEQYNQDRDDLELFLETDEIDDIGKDDKDQIIYHCKICKAKPILIKFTRKSNKFQSKIDILKLGKSMLKCDEILYLAVNSSSFYDTAFLRCLEFAYKIQVLNIEIIALTRSEYETITRSILIADKVVSKVAEYHISLVGIDIMMLRIACVLYQNNQIRRMNTQYSLKTTLFYIYLNTGEQEALNYYEYKKVKGYKNFKSRAFELYKREYKALYELNNLNRDKFNRILRYLMSTR